MTSEPKNWSSDQFSNDWAKMATVSAGDAQACQAALADTDKFLRNEVVGSQLAAKLAGEKKG